jgi:hypothetical protein
MQLLLRVLLGSWLHVPRVHMSVLGGLLWRLLELWRDRKWRHHWMRLLLLLLLLLQLLLLLLLQSMLLLQHIQLLRDGVELRLDARIAPCALLLDERMQLALLLLQLLRHGGLRLLHVLGGLQMGQLSGHMFHLHG